MQRKRSQAIAFLPADHPMDGAWATRISNFARRRRYGFVAAMLRDWAVIDCLLEHRQANVVVMPSGDYRSEQCEVEPEAAPQRPRCGDDSVTLDLSAWTVRPQPDTSEEETEPIDRSKVLALRNRGRHRSKADRLLDDAEQRWKKLYS